VEHEAEVRRKGREDEPRAFGVLLRQYRVAAGLTQDALAERARLSVRGIADLERGARRFPYSATVEQLAEALGLSPTERSNLQTSSQRDRARPSKLRLVPMRSAPTAEDDDSTKPAILPKRRHNLPAQLTSFVGRERQIEDLKQLLAEVRLLTLLGTGGIGKTRLALRLADNLVDAFRDGVWVVELAALHVPELVPATVAATLGVGERADQTATTTLQVALRASELLLVLDNCEHQVTACADLVETLLRACPGLRVITTSRQPLGVGVKPPGEFHPFRFLTLNPRFVSLRSNGAKGRVCFSSAPDHSSRGSHSRIGMRPQWLRYVSGWMVSRWLSSWRLRE